MKTESYLNLCIEQAAKSPLHYRHGAIVVRGGKVIGHGYNDYRPGFNGGALKSGRIAHGTFDGDAVQELKSKLKKKDKNKQQYQQSRQQSTGTFVPFEGTGGGHGANQPLSMHSEMMAIYSALSASSTMSSTTFSRQKSCFKLPRSDKSKARLRRKVVMSYVAAVCETSTCTGKTQVQECGFEASTSQSGIAGSSLRQQEQGGPHLQRQGGRVRGQRIAQAIGQGYESGVACGSKWRETSSSEPESEEEEEEEEEWEEGQESVSVRPVWETDTTRTGTTTFPAVCV